MLFYLADSLLVDKKSSEYFEIATAISNIAIAAFESKHSISGDIGILEFMSKNIDIDIEDVYYGFYKDKSIYIIKNSDLTKE